MRDQDPDEPDELPDVEVWVTREDDGWIGLHYAQTSDGPPNLPAESHVWISPGETRDGMSPDEGELGP